MTILVNPYELSDINFVYITKKYVDVDIFVKDHLAYRIYWLFNEEEPVILVETYNDSFINNNEFVLIGNFFKKLKSFCNRKKIKNYI